MIETNKHTVYDQFADKYDEWFETHPNYYNSELLALKQAVPAHGSGIEIGVGSGRFALPLNIKTGIEPSERMATLSRERGINIIAGVAENLPVKNATFDFAIMVTTVCFLNDVAKAFSEVNRVLKQNGRFIIGFIDRDNQLGKIYEQQRATNKFYTNAQFYSPEEIKGLLSGAGFSNFSFFQTLTNPDENNIEQPQPGYGKGSFVVVYSQKI
jgi:SAM-dependent methyltransferase